MLRFFSQAPDSQYTGAPAYLLAMQDGFSQQRKSGLIEVQVADDEQVFFLYVRGEMRSVYRRLGQQVLAISPDQAASLWTSGEAQLRFVELPQQAVRAAWQILEWYPPLQTSQVEGSALIGHLGNLKNLGIDGLIHIALQDFDGYVALAGGNIVDSETIFSTSGEFVSGIPSLRYRMGTDHESCQVTVYATRPGASSSEAYQLRIALVYWVDDIVGEYWKLVGHRLVNALEIDMNAAMRRADWNLRLVGAGLRDHHFFPGVQQAVEAYRVILAALLAHIEKVIGAGLAQHTMDTAFNRLNVRYQQELARYALGALAPMKADIRGG